MCLDAIFETVSNIGNSVGDALGSVADSIGGVFGSSTPNTEGFYQLASLAPTTATDAVTWTPQLQAYLDANPNAQVAGMTATVDSSGNIITTPPPGTTNYLPPGGGVDWTLAPDGTWTSVDSGMPGMTRTWVPNVEGSGYTYDADTGKMTFTPESYANFLGIGGPSTTSGPTAPATNQIGAQSGISPATMGWLGGGQVISGLLGAGAALKASDVQAKAAQNAANNQASMFQQTRADLLPYQAAGIPALNALTGLSGLQAGQNPLTSPLLSKFEPTMAQLEATPGYKFALQQGLRAAQNTATSRGVGVSGDAMRGAMDYAKGLASTTYQDQFNNYWNQNKNIASLLSSIVAGGQNAAAQTGTLGYQNTASAGGFGTQAGAAQGAGYVGAANAAQGATNAVTNMAMTNALLQGMYGKKGTANA